MYLVYMHRCKFNGKVYIGLTRKFPNERWKDGHGYSSCRYFNRAIQKYGWDNFEHIIVAENLTKEEACQLEKDQIVKYNSNNYIYGYNLTTGGDGCYELSEISRKRIGIANSKALKGRHLSDETKEKISIANKGKIVSQSTRDKLRNINKGRTSPNKGVPMSDEQKQKISVARTGFVMSDEQKEKLRLANLGKKQSEITKRKRAEKIKNRRYVNNGKENKRVPIEEVNKYLSNGYTLGIIHVKDRI